MRQERIMKSVIAVCVALVFAVVSGCSKKEKGPYKAQTLQTLDGKKVITFISPKKVEWKDGDWPKVVAPYRAERRGMLRVEVKLNGDVRVLFFTMTPDGLRDEEGVELYSKAALARKREELAKLEEDKKRRESPEFQEVIKKAEALLVPVKGGCFDMGNTFDEGEIDEKPAHKVCVDDFMMDKYEVTQAAYMEVMNENPSSHKDCDNCPVDKMTWFKAKEYCEWVKKRLPTEAEWEYAARDGGAKVRYATGKDTMSTADANYDSDGSVPVGSYAPNELGLYDMSGNVFEWVEDFYARTFYRNSPEKNPKYVGSGRIRVLRGGSWHFYEGYVRAAARYSSSPFYDGPHIGIRCVK